MSLLLFLLARFVNSCLAIFGVFGLELFSSS